MPDTRPAFRNTARALGLGLIVMDTSLMVRRRPTRGLTSVLFTDIVDSTHLASDMGDRRWRELLARHHRIVRGELKRYGGREVDTAGDGFFATFGQPASGVRCAAAVVDAVRDLGVEIRGGLHVGEVESAKGQTRGIAVHIGARITAHSGAGEVLVSATVRDLVAGSGLEFEDIGEHELKGVPGRWRLFRVIGIDGSPLNVPLAAEEAASRRARIEAPPVIRRRGTLLAAAGIAFVVMIAGIFLATSDERPLSEIPAASVGRIDPVEAEITDAFELDSDPTGIATEGDALWVISLNAQTLTLLDPVTGEVRGTLSTQGGPTDVEIGADGTVWVLNQFPDGTVIRFDPSATQVIYSESVGAGTNDMAVSEDAVWLTNEIDQTLLRLDVETNDIKEVLNRDEFDAAPRSVAVGEDYVWVAGGKEVVRMDIAGLDVEGISLRFESHDIHYGEGAVWLSHTTDDFVSRIDPESLTAVSIETPNGPAALASGYGFVWVAHPNERTLTRIDASSRQTRAIRVGSVPRAIASGGGAVWVAAGNP